MVLTVSAVQGVDHQRMVIDMNESRIRTLAQVRQFLAGTLQVSFRPCADDTERYEHINDVVHRFSYAALRKADRGVVLRYLRITHSFKPLFVRPAGEHRRRLDGPAGRFRGWCACR